MVEKMPYKKWKWDNSEGNILLKNRLLGRAIFPSFLAFSEDGCVYVEEFSKQKK